jgi:hypothetical protein
MPDHDAPQEKHLTVAERRARKSARLRTFVDQYGRKSQKGVEPNDRRYDRRVEATVKRMSPIELDRLLREDED